MQAVPAVFGTVDPASVLFVYCRALYPHVLLLEESWRELFLLFSVQ
jgi:hypothetical protein